MWVHPTLKSVQNFFDHIVSGPYRVLQRRGKHYVLAVVSLDRLKPAHTDLALLCVPSTTPAPSLQEETPLTLTPSEVQPATPQSNRSGKHSVGHSIFMTMHHNNLFTHYALSVDPEGE